MAINKQNSYIFGHCLPYGSKFSIVWRSASDQWDWAPVLFLFRKVQMDDRSSANILENGLPYIWRTSLIALSLPTAICFVLRLIILPQIKWWQTSCNQHLRPPESITLHWGSTWPSMGHVKQLPKGTFMNSPGLKWCTKCWEAYEHDQQFD